MSNSLSFGCVICNSKVEFTLMSDCTVINWDYIYDLSYDSSMKIKSISKISKQGYIWVIKYINSYVSMLSIY